MFGGGGVVPKLLPGNIGYFNFTTTLDRNGYKTLNYNFSF